MPVRFKGSSEYIRNYDWRDSYKSASFSPSHEQAASTAGVPSGSVEAVFEPPLQRKKKPIPLSTTNTTKFSRNSQPDEYVLLGAQNKFATNVLYRNPAPVVQAAQSTNNNAQPSRERHGRSDKSKTFKVPKKPSLKPPPVVDTTNYKPPSPIAPRSPGERRKILKETYRQPNQQAAVLPEPPSRVNGSSGDGKGYPKNGAPIQSALSKNNNSQVTKPNGDAYGAGAKSQDGAVSRAPISSRTQVLSKKAPPPKSDINVKDAMRAKRTGSMNEFVQTDMAKGVTSSAPEAPEEYALKYRAGVAPPRAEKKRKTEYQKEFAWKKPIDSAPIMSAEQVVYGSHATLGPSKSDPVPKMTEYERQFKPWHLYSKPVQENGSNKKSKMKRSKSEAELVPRTDEERRLLKEAQNPLKFQMPHGKPRRWKSEYKSNFHSPSKFKYEGGGWKGAAPPHINSQENVGEPESVPPVSNWYSEVLELRNKAEEYRKRSLGTHFSREHVAQLLARQAELWDEVSSSASLSALSLESAPVESAPRRVASAPVQNNQSANSNNNRANTREQPAASSKKEEVRRKLAWTDTDSVRSSLDSQTLTASSSEQTPVNDDDDGRIPTPELKQTGETRRHHLDVTTPAIGGALLVSPQPGQKQHRHQKHESRPSANTKSRKEAISDFQQTRVSKSYQPPQPARLTKPSHIPGGPYYHRHGDDSSDSGSSTRDTGLSRPKPQMSRSTQCSTVPPLSLPPDSPRRTVSDTNTFSSRFSGRPSCRTPSNPSSRKSYQPESRLSTTSPTLGMPTRDTHVLLDEEAPYDVPLETKFVHSPNSKKGASRDRPNSGSHYGRPMSAIPQKRQLTTIDEGMGRTYITPPSKALTRENMEKFSPPDEDDDSLSTSMQSLASSSSLASETLDRARFRRDEFWGKPGEARR